MNIKREDLDAGRIDLFDIASGDRIAPVHPGDILRAEFLDPRGMSVYALAKAIRVSRSRVNDITLGRRAISADTALRLSRYFGTTPEFWINLQSRYDLEIARHEAGDRINAEVPAPEAPAGVW
jgi:addiction module HigA family antidote